MRQILVIHGPNLNMLGKRNPDHYGTVTLEKINKQLSNLARSHVYGISFFQSNHEGKLIDFIQKHSEEAAGILINPGALTHYGYALRDALVDTQLPVVEVHLSDITKREKFRKTDVLNGIVVERVMGFKERSYIIGLGHLIANIHDNKKL